MASTSLPTNSIERIAPTHKRTYQACIPCRRRKVRCDLGSVDNPHDPPCVRCRREKKDCYFSETRRKRKAEDDGPRAAGELDEDYVLRNRRSQTARNGSFPTSTQDPIKNSPSFYSSYHDGPSPDDRAIREGDQVHPGPLGPSPSIKEGQEVTNEAAAALFQTPIHDPRDALHLLFEAAGRTDDLERERRPEDLKQSPRERHMRHPQTPVRHAESTARTSVIDPAIATDSRGDVAKGRAEFQKALQVWSRLRFVRAGWFTAQEAMSYIDYYYKELAPLTPISPPDFRSPKSHPSLLNEEPMLAVTMLTIASRYKVLDNPGGKSRSFMAHDKLWTYLQSMVTRMFWGQEQFGGGFCGAGASRKASGIGTNIGSLRNLGTIESLLLLSDWHPRAMHFPPSDDENEILVPMPADSTECEQMLSVPANVTNAGWIEPAIRSDRMCWSLIGCAFTLAYELGIFDSLATEGKWDIENGVSGRRESSIARILFIYVSQTSGRLGYPSMLPNQGRQPIMLSSEANAPNMDSFTVQPSEIIQRAWTEIATLMRLSNDDLFRSKSWTQDMIRSGRYLEALKEYGPRLCNWVDFWNAKFDSIKSKIEPRSRIIILMEYEYMRIYINSLALQAVLEGCATKTDGSGTVGISGGTPPALVPSSKWKLYKVNEPYIAEVIDASRSLLRHVAYSLLPNNGLMHAPVRTMFRILSAAMFLLKTFALGAKQDDVSVSIRILDDTVKAFRSSVVDDVHLILRFADLLEHLTSNIRNKFIRFAVPGNNTNKRVANGKWSHQRPSNTNVEPSNRDTDSDARDKYIIPSESLLYGDSNSTHDPLAGIATNPIDPNDSSISIMPPPDFIYNNFNTGTINNNVSYSYPTPSHPNPQLYPQQMSPRQNQTYSQQQYSASPPQQQQQISYNPGYDWITLDLQPLADSNYANTTTSSQVGNVWAGAFGPEISDSLDLLGTLILNDPYSMQTTEGDNPGWT